MKPCLVKAKGVDPLCSAQAASFVPPLARTWSGAKYGISTPQHRHNTQQHINNNRSHTNTIPTRRRHVCRVT